MGITIFLKKDMVVTLPKHPIWSFAYNTYYNESIFSETTARKYFHRKQSIAYFTAVQAPRYCSNLFW